MAIDRLPIVTSHDPEFGFQPGTTSTNVFYDRYPDGKQYVTQRPPLNFIDSPSLHDDVPGVGRGIYYWEVTSSYYYVSGQRVQRGYGNNIGDISNGTERVYFIEADDRLLIIDPENNEGWQILDSAPTVLASITDQDFPPNQNPAKQLAGGGAYLGGYACVMDTDGIVYSSDLGNAGSWNALDFIGASREKDTGIFLTKHHDNLVAVGTRSIEFFYNAGNPVGSPFSQRQDISYRVGCIGHDAIDAAGDTISFLGAQGSGTLALYRIENFQLTKVSNFSIDGFLGLTNDISSRNFFVAQLLWNDHFLTIITAYNPLSSTNSSVITLVHDKSTGLWSQYSTTLNGLSNFPVVAVADRVAGDSRNVALIMNNGDVAELFNSLSPFDFSQTQTYVAPGYIQNQDDYVVQVGSNDQAEIRMDVRFTEHDLGSMPNKFAHALWVVGSSTVGNVGGQGDFDISWTDNHYDSFTQPRQLPVGRRQKLTRLGHYNRRAYRITYQGPITQRIEAIEVHTGASRYA